MHLTIRYFPFLISLAQLLVLSNGQQIVVNRILDGFRWSNPFHSGEGGVTTPAGFRATCEVAAMFRARQHSVHDVNSPPPLGLAPWADAIKYFFGGRPFPGSWEGLDPQDVMDRDIVMMEYKDVPAAVRDWLREQKKDAESEGRWLFAVYGKPKETGPGDEEKVLRQADLDEGPDEDKVILFAPGAIYEILPLWVADGSDCSVDLKNLSLYQPVPEGKAVIAWLFDKTEPRYEDNSPDITFTIRAQVVEKSPTDGGNDTADQKTGTETDATKKQTAAEEGTSKDEL